MDRTARLGKAESSSNIEESQVENPSDLDGLGKIRNRAHALPLPQALPSIADTKSTMNNMYFTSLDSGYTRRVAQETCSNVSESSEESQQVRYSPLTSDTSEEMNTPTPLLVKTGTISRAERLGDQSRMVLVERAPQPLPSRQNIPLRRSPPQHHRPLSQAPVLFRPVLIPAALHPLNAKSGQVPPVVRDLNRYILVRARNYEKMSNAVLQQALQLIQAPSNVRTKPKALRYLKSYFLAVRDRSHIIYVEKYKLVSAAIVCD
jgi:hypothetical protein